MIYNFNDFLNEGGPILTEAQHIEIIQNKCKELGYEFRGFVNGKYTGKDSKLILYCPKHDLEWSTTSYHNFKRNKSKCEKCSRESSSNLQLTPEPMAIANIKKICAEKDYEFLGFVDGWKGKDTYLKLRCNKDGHGDWSSTVYMSFLNGRGCPICGKEISKESKRLTEEEAVSEILDNCKKRNYEFLGFVGGKYIKNTTKLILKCLKNEKHGIWQSTSYNGFINSNVGCPICNESRGATKVADALENFGYVHLKEEKLPNIKYYSREYSFPDCKGLTTDIKRSRTLPFDFYLYDLNTCIEFDGRQHYEPAFGERQLELTKENDQIKNEYCNGQNGRPTLIRIPYTEFKNIEEILIKKLNLY